jgi:S-adenosylmethionine:tRNA ribosyltransferase-isomerase
VTPATWPRDEPLDERLLVLDPRAGDWRDARVRDLPRHLSAGDLLVVNDAATVPASLSAVTARGEPVEVRLAAHLGDEPEGTKSPNGGSGQHPVLARRERWRAVLLGAGDWHTRTEHRAAPPPVGRGERLRIAPELEVVVEELDPMRPRLLVVRFLGDLRGPVRCDSHRLGDLREPVRCDSHRALKGAALWAALYRHGRPVQYAHVDRALDLWHVQTPFASRPWAVEMPSAGRPLTWALLGELRARGVRLASLTHAAGLSSTGDPAIDAALPLPERFDVPAATVRAIAETHRAGRRVVAAGTTVVRALEGSARMNGGELLPGEGTTDLRIDASFRPRIVDGLLTGLHELGSSHRQLMQAFAPEPLLALAWTHAEERGYQDHEFGDVCLVLPRLKAA